jgi:hypothetical protein
MGRRKTNAVIAESKKAKTFNKAERFEERMKDQLFSVPEPSFSRIQFDSFQEMAQSFDSLITEFYHHYDQSKRDEPNMFGFVSVTHEVKFENIERMRTENVVGQKGTVIFAPIIHGENSEERTARELRILAAFDPTKRSNHIMALTLLMAMLGKKGVTKLFEKQKERGQQED